MSVSLTMVVVITSVTTTMVDMNAHADQAIPYRTMDVNVLVSAVGLWNNAKDSVICFFLADPCEAIMAPQNGSISCTSGMVGGATDDNCTFACHFGFELENANHRTCLPNHTWSGVETYCRIKQCPILQAIPDGTVRLPCATEYTTFCTMDCDPGYYLIGNADRMCFVVDFDANEVNWVGEYAECNGK